MNLYFPNPENASSRWEKTISKKKQTIEQIHNGS